jgi:hypothetical protein
MTFATINNARVRPECLELQGEQVPPDCPPLIALDMEDSPEGMADKIANLTLAEAVQLSRYLEGKHSLKGEK